MLTTTSTKFNWWWLFNHLFLMVWLFKWMIPVHHQWLCNNKINFPTTVSTYWLPHSVGLNRNVFLFILFLFEILLWCQTYSSISTLALSSVWLTFKFVEFYCLIEAYVSGTLYEFCWQFLLTIFYHKTISF